MDIIGNYSLVINLILILIKIPMIFIKNYLALKFSKVKHIENYHAKLTDSKLFSVLIFELIINFFTPTKIFDFSFFDIRYSFNSTYTDTEEDPSIPKLKQQYFYYSYNINDLLTIITLIRLLYSISYLNKLSKYSSNSALRSLRIMNQQPSLSFVVWALF